MLAPDKENNLLYIGIIRWPQLAWDVGKGLSVKVTCKRRSNIEEDLAGQRPGEEQREQQQQQQKIGQQKHP